jgi:hypothetical protein
MADSAPGEEEAGVAEEEEREEQNLTNQTKISRMKLCVGVASREQDRH